MVKDYREFDFKIYSLKNDLYYPVHHEIEDWKKKKKKQLIGFDDLMHKKLCVSFFLYKRKTMKLIKRLNH